MKKTLYFVVCMIYSIVSLTEVYGNDTTQTQHINKEQAAAERPSLTFDKNQAILFLESGLASIDQNLSLIYAKLSNKTYRTIPSALDETWEENTQLRQIEDDIVASIQRSIAILQNEQSDTESFLLIAKQIYDFTTFMIAYIRWDICEIQYDGYRSKSPIGWYQSIDDEVARYAIGKVDYDSNISVSLYHKGKFSILNPREDTLAPLLKRVQFEELARCKHLYSAIQAYIRWFYTIFGYNETTTTIIQKLIKNTEYLFEEHIKCFTLDQIIRFKGKEDILGKLLY